jgi:hypothetical protein
MKVVLNRTMYNRLHSFQRGNIYPGLGCIGCENNRRVRNNCNNFKLNKDLRNTCLNFTIKN